MRFVTSILKKFAVLFCPKFFFEYQMRSKSHEEELLIISQLLPKGGTAVDVGANEGLYVYHLQKRASRVLAFEPFPHLARNLQRKAASNVTVHNVALSNKEGEVELRYPKGALSWATVEDSNTLHRVRAEKVRSLTVPLKTLDSFSFSGVDFMKIDVEGHELAVLEGAINTICAAHPTILVEVEDVHNPGSVQRTREFLERLGYEGHFIVDGVTYPIEAFRLDRDQNSENVGIRGKTGRYINNFLFVPRNKQILERKGIETDQ